MLCRCLISDATTDKLAVADAIYTGGDAGLDGGSDRYGDDALRYGGPCLWRWCKGAQDAQDLCRGDWGRSLREAAAPQVLVTCAREQ